MKQVDYYRKPVKVEVFRWDDSFDFERFQERLKATCVDVELSVSGERPPFDWGEHRPYVKPRYSCEITLRYHNRAHKVLSIEQGGYFVYNPQQDVWSAWDEDVFEERFFKVETETVTHKPTLDELL